MEERSNEIVEMERGSDGSYEATEKITVKARRCPQRTHPQQQRAMPTGTIRKFHEFLGGFLIGLDAVERFYEVLRRGGYRG